MSSKKSKYRNNFLKINAPEMCFFPHKKKTNNVPDREQM